jgi:hypothetical protein
MRGCVDGWKRKKNERESRRAWERARKAIVIRLGKSKAEFQLACQNIYASSTS